MVAAAFDRARLIPLQGTLFGAWVQAPPDRRQAAISEQEQVLGRPFDIVHDFHGFAEPFPTEFDRWAAASRTLFLSWNGTKASSILDGSQDTMIRTRARALRDLHAPVLLRFWWEMNTQEKAAWADPSQFVAAWRHVRTLFAEEGADRVSWVWCPTSEAFAPTPGHPDGDAQRWWPGDEWVDWVCADGYNFAPAVAGAAYRSFDEIFASFHQWARRTGKPMMIGEFGVLERNPGEKPRWLSQTTAALTGPYADLSAVVYFDSRRTVNGGVRDWRVTTSPSSEEAFRALTRAVTAHLRRLG